jgi:hypothetical protein
MVLFWMQDRESRGGTDFDLLRNVLTESGAHTVTYLIGTEGSFSGGTEAIA